MSEIRLAGLVGGGVIGSGWAARLLLNGIDVALFDADPDIARKVEAVLANARRAYGRLLPDLVPREGVLRLASDVEDAVADADFVQESLPEREDLKRRLLARIDRATRPDVLIASSTSGLLPTQLQADMVHAERFVVGHPFNPVYLLPLVEVCGGQATAPDARERAADFYRSLGMHPLQVRQEIDGFIADRLLEALWREALWLVEAGVATTAEIDDAIRYGAGLRWAFMGTFLLYRLAGGEAGMRHFLSQFGPALRLPWTRLEAPELTDGLADRIVAQSDAQADGVPVRELERLRDDCLVAILAALRGQNYASGVVVRAFESRLAAKRNGADGADQHDLSKPLRLLSARVEPDWLDYNGHMTESRYLQVFSNASDALLRHIGVDAAYVATGKSYYTAETHIMHLQEARVDEALHVTTQVLGADAKRMHLLHTLHRTPDDTPLATAEQMLLHVDTALGRAAPAEPAVSERLRRIASAQARLPRPQVVGRHVGAPRGS